MTQGDFERVINQQIQHCTDLLISKGKEYAGMKVDRLHTFKRAAVLQEETPAEALIGMFTKHVISIYDMARDSSSYPLELWDEKITDAINYLLILKTVIVEGGAKHAEVQ